MPEINIPKSNKDDVFSMGFDKNLNRNTYVSGQSPVVYNDIKGAINTGQIPDGGILNLDNINIIIGRRPSSLNSSAFFPESILTTCFEALARFRSTLVGSGSFALSASGGTMGTGATATSSSNTLWEVDSGGLNADVFSGSPAFSTRGNISPSGTASSFVGIGTVTVDGTGHTFTTRHAGFKFLIVAGVASLYATQGDGTTENSSTALTTFVSDDTFEVVAKMNGNSSIDYYWRKNGGALSVATNLALNMPSGGNIYNCQFSISNNSTANGNTLILQGASFRR